jgi:CRISPR-associated endonuclease/helicase Cas3
VKVEFWAKTTADKKPGISVFEHMVNVGHVAHSLAETAPDLLNRFQIGAAEVGALAALHDLGKVSPGFQQKCEAWLAENRLQTIAQHWTWDTSMESDHGKVTHATVQEFLVSNGTDRRAAKFLSAVLGGHHGRLNPPNDRGFKPRRLISEQHTGIDWGKERNDAAGAVCRTFDANFAGLLADSGFPALWWLAGLTSVSDWIGSDETFFSAHPGLPKTDAATIARQAIATIGFVPPEIVAGLSLHDLFHDEQTPHRQFIPNDMQLRAISTITEPGVYVIEAPMGMGKTEAALGAAYQLLANKKARGIYFALPTQVTSNRMHRRMAEFVRRIAPATAGSRLIHANSWLLREEIGFSPAASGEQAVADDARIGRDWFASAKRALLAPFGVGTVDQALLGVVAAKHFFVRHYALAGKVVILDEIHSYDIYTGTLIDKLIAALEGLGCTIIVLSATLTGRRRNQIIGLGDEEDSNDSLPYPLITGRRENEPFTPVSATPPQSRDVEVVFEAQDDAMKEAVALAECGGCVLWVCNTVRSAQEQYQRLQASARDHFRLGLLHSRFPFWRREELENEWMERLGKHGATRCASILVSTQIVEQSVDLDADLLITELAPTDMLLQRTGRLWRHPRDLQDRPPASSPRLIVLEETTNLEDFRRMEAKTIVQTLGSKACVYAPYVLLRSLEVWNALQGIAIPTQVRSLIEETYEERGDEPESWQTLFGEWFATDSGKKFFANRNSNLWTVALEDEEGVQTRLNEILTLSLVLCRRISKTAAEFIDGSGAVLGGDEFRLATAQAIHRNLVRVPVRHFAQMQEYPGIARYLRGPQSIGVVDRDGTIKVEGLQNGVRLCWSNELGIIITNTSNKGKQ